MFMVQVEFAIKVLFQLFNLFLNGFHHGASVPDNIAKKSGYKGGHNARKTKGESEKIINASVHIINASVHIINALVEGRLTSFKFAQLFHDFTVCDTRRDFNRVGGGGKNVEREYQEDENFAKHADYPQKSI